MIYLAADHGGYQLKEFLKTKLKDTGLEYRDFGAYELQPNDDYPDYVKPLSQTVATEKDAVGIVICRNGVGVCLAANQQKGVRCGLSFSPTHAASARNDDHANVLALPAGYLSPEEAWEITKTWLATPYSPEERFARRLNKL